MIDTSPIFKSNEQIKQSLSRFLYITNLELTESQKSTTIFNYTKNINDPIVNNFNWFMSNLKQIIKLSNVTKSEHIEEMLFQRLKGISLSDLIKEYDMTQANISKFEYKLKNKYQHMKEIANLFETST